MISPTSVILVLVAALLAAGIAVAVRLPRKHGVVRLESEGPSGSQVVRRFFQYLLLAGLLIVAAIGISGLLARALDPDPTPDPDRTQLALQLAFVIIALPLWVALAWWTRARAGRDPAEYASREWAAYLTVVGVVSLITAMVGWYRTLSMLTGAAPYAGSWLATAIVWSAVWGGHRRWGRRTAPPNHLRLLVLAGSLVGLATAANGLSHLLSSSVRGFTGLGGESIIHSPLAGLLRAASLFVVGAAAWIVYWLRDARRGPQTGGRLAFVLLAGIGGGLVIAMSMLGTLAFEVLVWLLGEPYAAAAAEHFADAPELAGTGAVGLLSWWYHQAVLEDTRVTARTEARRVYEYLMAAIGLIAATAGVVMVLVTVIESIVGTPAEPTGRSAQNTLLAALVLLGFGIPVWWWYWRMAQRSRATDPAGEVSSISRRIYLLVLFGVAGIAAVIALITLVYLVLQDVLGDGVDERTVSRIRYALGILLATSLIAGYHWTVFRDDRHQLALSPSGRATVPAAPAHPVVRRSVLVLGDLDEQSLTALAKRTDLDVQLWHTAGAGSEISVPATTSSGVGSGDARAEELAGLIETAPAGDLVVLALDGTVRVLPAQRRRTDLSGAAHR